MIRPGVVEPTVRDGSHGERIYEHPAFGMIGGSRVMGSSVLFGSDFEHRNFVEIRVRRASLRRDLSRDWHFGEDEIVSVRLSEAQWATFVSSLNNGDGVPCTLDYVQGEPMPALPLRRGEDAAREDAKAHFGEMAGLVDKAIREVEEGVGSALSKVKREAILESLRTLRREVPSNTPFMLDSFERHMETTVERAKVEIEAHTQNAITRAGLAALGVRERPLLRLASGDEEGGDHAG